MLINMYFGKFESSYVGSPFMIGGNQIYSAIIHTKGLKEVHDIKKVSHGVFHTIAPEDLLYSGKNVYNKKDWYGHPVGEKINLNAEHIKKYKDFISLRTYTPFIKDNNIQADFDRVLRKNTFNLKSGDVIDMFHVDRLSFFIAADHEIKLDNLQLGAKRNMGFGMLTITNQYSLELETLDFSEFGDNSKLIETAKNGITGILNHSKYGYGEFKLEKWGNKDKDDKDKDEWLIKLISPLCLQSTIKDSYTFDKPPPFMQTYTDYVSNEVRKHREFIWMNGKAESLYCISDGSVFVYEACSS